MLNPNLRMPSSEGGAALEARSSCEPRSEDGLDELHALLGHYARQLRDVQQLRVATGNRVAAMKRDGFADEWLAPQEHLLVELKALEKAVDRQLTALMRRHPLRSFIDEARGIALPGAARLLGVTGSLDRFSTVSKLWAYLGLHVVDGKAPRRARGTKANWSPEGRKTCFVLGENIVRSGGDGPYRAAYDEKKAAYLARKLTGPSECPFGHEHRAKSKGGAEKPGAAPCSVDGHVHNAAKRYAVKFLLREMWREWRRVQGAADGQHDDGLAPANRSPEAAS